jgi:aryl-alcohol dehydrogenase-like predicted oxidoreductase
MKRRKAASMKEEFSVIGFGCWAVSGAGVWNKSNDIDSIKAIQKALDLGVNFFDVAPVYGFGHAEEVLGKALKGNRQKVLIASKCGLVWDSQYRIKNQLTAESIYKEIDDSLRRLNTDYIDIYQIHWPDPNTPIEETMEALINIKKAGKIRNIGVSNFPVELTKKAMEMDTIVSQQCLYNMLERNEKSYHSIPLEYRTEKEILPFCRENGQAFFPYSPLCQGLLTGTFKETDNFDEKDVRANNPKFKGEIFIAYLQTVEKLKEIAKSIGKPLNQLAINWLVKNDVITSVICGAQNIEHVEENVASIEWELSDDTIREIDKLLDNYKND